MNILNDFYRPAVLSDDHVFSESGIYHQMNVESTHKVCVCTALRTVKVSCLSSYPHFTVS